MKPHTRLQKFVAKHQSMLFCHQLSEQLSKYFSLLLPVNSFYLFTLPYPQQSFSHFPS
jgi:hypothetical protein